MSISRLALPIALVGLRTAAAQRPSPPRVQPDTIALAWIYADTSLVRHPPWISATVVKNVLDVAFKDGTSAKRRDEVFGLIHGTVIYNDRLFDDDGIYYVRVASHPDACAVKQAMDLLEHADGVDMVTPEMVFSMDDGGGLVDVPARHAGSQTPCPPGTGLLQ